MGTGERSGYVEVDGELLPDGSRHLSALDRGFTLSDGVFETILITGGRAFRLGAHLSRLRASAAVLRIPIPRSDGDLAAAIDRVREANGLREAVVRLTVSRGVPAERGLLPPSHPAPTVVIQASPFHPLPAERAARGFHTVVSTIRRNEHSPTSRIKSCGYLDNVLARMEAQSAGADEAILLNTAGELACCGAANLHLVRHGRVLTPAPECGALAGITRQAVRELAAKLSFGWEEGRLTPNDLLSAEEAFLTNSVLGIVPITSVAQGSLEEFPDAFGSRPAGARARPERPALELAGTSTTTGAGYEPRQTTLGNGKPGPVTLRLRHQYQTLLDDQGGEPDVECHADDRRWRPN